MRRLQRFRAKIRQKVLMVLKVRYNLLFHLRLCFRRHLNLSRLSFPCHEPLPVDSVAELLSLTVLGDLKVLEVLVA